MTTQHGTDIRHSDGHEEVWKLLPWYVNGTLNTQEVEDVEVHLAACSACQIELARCRDIAAAVRAAREDPWVPSPGHFNQVLAQIDAAEAHQPPDKGWWAYLLRYWTWLQETPCPVRWALAFQGALVLVLATVLVWHTASSPPLLYEILSSEAEPVPAGRIQLRMIFAEDTTEKELRELLSRIEATIVQGPSPAGVYTVEVPQADSALESVLKELRAHPKVHLAELISFRSVP